MNISLLNGFFDNIVTIVDMIPKVFYMLCASLASAIDAMQALIRKLAGLDVYYQTVENVGGNVQNAISNTDPLTEFIYGILGFGDSAPLYEALNVVFWSFAIFGLIVLAVTTIVAIIKSHYNEDSGGTSPSKFLYTAAKSIFTFAIVPVIVIVGLQLSSFILRTLDNITAGSGTEEEVHSLFGSEVVNSRFRGESDGDSISYTYYDFFGYGECTNVTTFSGMLFNASAYSCNRARTHSFSLDQLRNFFGSGGTPIFGHDSSDYPQSGSTDERYNYIADQIDYLFSNNVQLNSDYSYWTLVSEASGVNVWGATDLYGYNTVSNFSKFHVAIVWLFYDLWNFNFIISLIGSLVTFGLMISIILGMMTRLIKGAALFLVYPSILGIAPLDSFKAFKGWTTNFIQQLMMAFGSIVGINLMLLILPYVQNINFFNIGVVDYMVRLVMLVAGLLMAKEFISMINGFVGGADAASAGEPLKGQFKSGISKGLKFGANAAGGTIRTGAKVGVLATRAAIGVGRSIKSRVDKRTSASRATKLDRKLKGENGENLLDQAQKSLNQARRTAKGRILDSEMGVDLQKQLNKDINDYRNAGYNKKTAENMAKQKYNKNLNELIEQDSNVKESQKKVNKLNSTKKKRDDIVDQYGLTKGTYNGETKYYKNEKTEEKGNELIQKADKKLSSDMKKSMNDIGATMADGFIKTVKSFTGDILGLDKTIDSAKKTLKGALTFDGGMIGNRMSENKKKAEEKEAKAAAEQKDSEAASHMSAQTNSLNQILAQMQTLNKASGDNATAISSVARAIKGLNGDLKAIARSNNNANQASSTTDKK